MRKHCGNCANYKKETNQFSEECGRCVAAILENGERTDPSHWREKPKTNADRIRSMSDELLASQMVVVVEETIKILINLDVPDEVLNEVRSQILERLKQPAEEE